MRDILIEATSSMEGTRTFNLKDLFRKNQDMPCEYKIIGKDLSNNDYTDCIIDGMYFFDCTFENSMFRNATIKNSLFVRCNFNGCRFESCIIDKVDMGESLLETTRFDRHCSIHDVCLNTAKITDKTILHIPMACPEEGGFIAWKKAVVPMACPDHVTTFYSSLGILVNKVLIKLFVPAGAKRSSAASNKCRCSKAKVLGFYDYAGNDMSKQITKAWSWKDPDFKYELGKYVSVDDFDENRWHECASGIHFFMDKDTAIRYII